MPRAFCVVVTSFATMGHVFTNLVRVAVVQEVDVSLKAAKIRHVQVETVMLSTFRS
jgi:hypothetical protein